MAKQSTPTSIPDALKNFDSLPDSAWVREPIVKALLGCSSATVWRYAKMGIIPAPQKRGPRISAWNVGELRRSLVQRAA